MSASIFDQILALDPNERRAYLERIGPGGRDAISRRLWRVIARTDQLGPPGDWRRWLVIAGRGAGKTRAGAEWMLHRRRRGLATRAAVVGETAHKVRSVMIEGESGILACARRMDENPLYEPAKRQITWKDGSVWGIFSADEPDQLRGPAHDSAWIDEIASMRRAEDMRDNLLLGLRVGDDPRSVWTGTPKPVPVVKSLIRDAADPAKGVVVTRASTYDNLANLAEGFRLEILAQYEGTRLGRQELHGEILDELGAMFQRSWFPILDERPDWPGATTLRYWDLAATPESDASPDPDWTAGALVIGGEERWCVADMRHLRGSPATVEDVVVATARLDGPGIVQWIEQEPGSSGKALIDHYASLLRPHGILVRAHRPTGPKAVRAGLLAAAAEQGKVSIVAGPWTTALLDELEEFTADDTHAHDDQVDAISGGFGQLTKRRGRLLVG